MNFGQVQDPSEIDFTLPKDHPRTKEILKENKSKKFHAFVGCAKWNKTDLKGFYPKGTKDELTYYATQFNSIELNATFYSMPSPTQVEIWRDKTPKDFKFFPKISNTISHFRRLKDVTDVVTIYATSVLNFDEKLGMVFLQLHDNFKPKDYERFEAFIKNWPKEVPLAVELRNEEWFADEEIFNKTMELFEEYKITNITVDAAGRRDMLHMRLTTNSAFIRYVGANDKSDYERLDDWIERIKIWKKEGLENLYFFVHQNIEKASPLLSAYFIEKLNKEVGTELTVPKLADEDPPLF